MLNFNDVYYHEMRLSIFMTGYNSMPIMFNIFYGLPLPFNLRETFKGEGHFSFSIKLQTMKSSHNIHQWSKWVDLFYIN